MNEFLLVAKNLEIRELGNSVEVGGEANDIVNNGKNDESEAGRYEETETQHNIHRNDNVTDSIQHEADTGALSTDSRFACDECDKSFAKHSGLYRHLSMHKGVKFRCEECNKEFAQKVTLLSRVERDEYRRPKTYAVREKFSLFLICWVEREKLLFILLKSGFDDAMNMENDNINNSLECLEMS